MIIEYFAEISIANYLAGILLWFFLWYKLDMFKSLSYNKLLYFPLILVPIILILESLFIFLQPHIISFAVEEQLIIVIERNNSQLLTASFGILVLATIFINLKFIKGISKNFIVFLSFALICSVGGVLVLYWLPTVDPKLYFLLRHFKTIPYTFSIGFFLSGLLTLIREIPTHIAKKSK